MYRILRLPACGRAEGAKRRWAVGGGRCSGPPRWSGVRGRLPLPSIRPVALPTLPALRRLYEAIAPIPGVAACTAGSGIAPPGALSGCPGGVSR